PRRRAGGCRRPRSRPPSPDSPRMRLRAGNLALSRAGPICGRLQGFQGRCHGHGLHPMPSPARNTLAIIGAGPVGLEAALAALDAGFDVHVFERGEAGAHPIAWGHVVMFTPWRMNWGPSSLAHLERAGWTRPDPEAFPSGLE